MCKHDKMMEQVMGFTIAVYKYDDRAKLFQAWFEKQANLQDDFQVEIREEEDGLVLEVMSFHPEMTAETPNILYGASDDTIQVSRCKGVIIKGNC